MTSRDLPFGERPVVSAVCAVVDCGRSVVTVAELTASFPLQSLRFDVGFCESHAGTVSHIRTVKATKGAPQVPARSAHGDD